MIALTLALALQLAEPPASDRDAAAEFDRGTQAYEAGDIAGALAAFQRAQSLRPHDRVRANIARCLAELGRTREAIAELEAALAGTELDDAERTIVRAQIETLRSELGEQAIVPATKPPIVQPEPEAPPPPRAPAPADRPPPPRQRNKPSALTWIGLPLTALGTAGAIGFGVRTRQHHDAYLAMPDDATRTRGLRTRALTNASIAVLSLGAALVLADLVRIAVRARAPRSRSAAHVRRGFGMM